MQNDTQIIILVSSIILILTVTITVFVIVRIRHQKKIGKPGVFGEFPDNTPVKFAHNETAFEYTYHPNKKNSPAFLSLETACRTTGAFRIKKETKVEKFFKWMDVNKEIQTGDFQFDEKLYIITEEPEFTKSVLFNSKIRQTINTLFDLGITHVTVNTNSINAIVDTFNKNSINPIVDTFNNNISKADLLKVAELLTTIVSQLPKNTISTHEKTIDSHPFRIPQHREHPFKGPWSTKRIFSYVSSIALIILGAILLGIGISSYPLLDPGTVVLDSLNYSVPILIMTVWLMIILLRGRANSHIDFIVIFSFNLFAVPFSTVGAMYYINGSQDNTPVTTHEKVIHHKYYRSDKNNKTYYVSVKSWRGGVDVENIRVNRAAWQQTNVNNSKISLSTRNGYLGYEWLQSYTLIDG